MSAWVNYLTNTVGATHLFRVNETTTAFVDVIGGLSVGYTSGLGTNQISAIPSEPGNGSVSSTATVVTTRSGASTLGGPGLQGPYALGFFFRVISTPASSAVFVSFGDGGAASRGIVDVLYRTSTTPHNFSILVPGINFQSITTDFPGSGWADGEWHLILLNYDLNNSSFWKFSVDGAAFQLCGGAPMFMNGTPVFVGVNILNENGALDAAGLGVDEIFVVDRELLDAEAAGIYATSQAMGDKVLRPNMVL